MDDEESTITIKITFRVKLMSFSGYAMLEGFSGYAGGILWLCYAGGILKSLGNGTKLNTLRKIPR